MGNIYLISGTIFLRIKQPRNLFIFQDYLRGYTATDEWLVFLLKFFFKPKTLFPCFHKQQFNNRHTRYDKLKAAEKFFTSVCHEKMVPIIQFFSLKFKIKVVSLFKIWDKSIFWRFWGPYSLKKPISSRMEQNRLFSVLKLKRLA